MNYMTNMECIIIWNEFEFYEFECARTHKIIDCYATGNQIYMYAIYIQTKDCVSLYCIMFYTYLLKYKNEQNDKKFCPKMKRLSQSLQSYLIDTCKDKSHPRENNIRKL